VLARASGADRFAFARSFGATRRTVHSFAASGRDIPFGAQSPHGTTFRFRAGLLCPRMARPRSNQPTHSTEPASAGSAEGLAFSSSLRWAIGLLALGLILRLASAHIYWSWFDTRFPDTWAHSKIELSQDGSEYVLQADPGTWNSYLHRGWSDRAYFRPPLASYYFVALFRLFDFNRFAVSAAQSAIALAARGFSPCEQQTRLGASAACRMT